jgi:hypothetical protein
MATTYTLISTVTVGSGGAASISFSSIPQTYTDLELVISARGSGNGGGPGNAYITGTFNASGSNFTWSQLWGNGSTASSNNSTSAFIGSAMTDAFYTASTFGNGKLTIPNYTTANYKSYSVDSVDENNGSASYTLFIAGLWSNTAAITAITLTGTSNFVQYSSASLYGILKT